jgi:hypothetical protein
MIVLDAASLPAELAQQPPGVAEWVGKAEGMLDTIDREMQDAENWKKRHKAVLANVAKLTDECEKDAEQSLYGASMSCLLGTFRKMSAFDPGFSRPDIPPGSAQEAMILGMTEDIPGDLSAAWLMKQLRAYCPRARAAIARERLLYPLRFSFAYWDPLVENLKTKAGDAVISEGKENFDALVAASTQNCKLIRNDKEWFNKRLTEATLDETESVMSGLANVVNALVERRLKGEDPRVDAQEKSARVAFASLDNSLRLIPK